MNNKQRDSNKTLLISSVIFIAVAIILFIIQNFAISGQKIETMNVFVANKEIKPYDALTADMFTVTAIPLEGNSVIQKGYVTNVQEFANMFTNATISKGEILSKSRLIADNGEKGLNYTILLDAPYIGDVAYGDNVKVYAMDSTTNAIDVLFKRKKIYKSKVNGTQEVSQEDIATAEATGTSYEAASTMYIKVSATELKEYFTLRKSKELIVVPITSDDTIDTSSLTDKNAGITEENESTVNTAITNHVVTGDNETLETIAKQYNVSVESLIRANPTIDNSSKTISKGTEISIPASEE